jgi:hypothetical protein
LDPLRRFWPPRHHAPRRGGSRARPDTRPRPLSGAVCTVAPPGPRTQPALTPHARPVRHHPAPAGGRSPAATVPGTRQACRRCCRAAPCHATHSAARAPCRALCQRGRPTRIPQPSRVGRHRRSAAPNHGTPVVPAAGATTCDRRSAALRQAVAARLHSLHDPRASACPPRSRHCPLTGPAVVRVRRLHRAVRNACRPDGIQGCRDAAVRAHRLCRTAAPPAQPRLPVARPSVPAAACPSRPWPQTHLRHPPPCHLWSNRRRACGTLAPGGERRWSGGGEGGGQPARPPPSTARPVAAARFRRPRPGAHPSSCSPQQARGVARRAHAAPAWRHPAGACLAHAPHLTTQPRHTGVLHPAQQSRTRRRQQKSNLLTPGIEPRTVS